MAQVSLPYTLTAGTPENVNNLMSNLNALVAGVNTVDTAQLAASAVTSAKLATDSVTAAKIATDSVTAAKIAADSVTAAKIAADAVGSSEIAAGAVGTSELASAVGNFGAWTSYTPTLTGATVGSDGTTAGKYCQIGKLVAFRASFTFGSTSAVSAAIQFSLPVTAATSDTGVFWGSVVDNGTTTYPGFVDFTSTTKIGLWVQDSSGTYVVYAGYGATTPMTWVSGDNATVGGVYEAA